MADVVSREREGARGNGHGVGPWLGRRGRVTGRDADEDTAARARRVEGEAGAFREKLRNSRTFSSAARRPCRMLDAFQDWISRASEAPSKPRPLFPVHCQLPSAPPAAFSATIPPAAGSNGRARTTFSLPFLFGPTVVHHTFLPDQLTSRRYRLRDPVPSDASLSVPSASSQPAHVRTSESFSFPFSAPSLSVAP